MPDKYAGKAIRCPACNRAFNVPKPTAAVGAAGASGLDLEGLAQLEAGTMEMSDEDRAEAEGALAAQAAAEATGEAERTCPHCNYATKVEDPYVEVLCPHCWKAIPALVRGSRVSRTRSSKYAAPGATSAGGFYTELASSVAYPVPALASLLTAAGIAFLAAVLPVAIMTGGANLMEQSQVGTEAGVQAADLSGVRLILMGIFAAEVFFFSAVATHSFFDIVRTTSIGDDKPPKLSFSPSQWGKSFASYLVLAGYFCLMTYVVAWLTIGEDFIARLSDENVNVGDVLASGGTGFGVGMVIISMFIPMNLLGISLGNIGQALNPLNVVKSAARTHAHYVFLVLILLVYGGLFGYAFFAIVFDWFMPQISTMLDSSTEGNLTNVALPLLAWGGVMASFFYGSYILARLHGLFARTFRKQLLFGTQ